MSSSICRMKNRVNVSGQTPRIVTLRSKLEIKLIKKFVMEVKLLSSICNLEWEMVAKGLANDKRDLEEK